MKKFYFLIFTILFSTFFLAYSDEAFITFKASVYIDNQKAPIGTVVRLKDINGNNYTQGDSALVINSLSTVTITAYGDDPNTAELEPGFAIGDKIYFYINGKKATVDCQQQNCDYFTNPSVPPAPPALRYVSIYVSSTVQRDTCIFSGNVLIDGEYAPFGTEVKVYNKLETKLYASVTVGNTGGYSIVLPGDDPETSEQDGPVDGDTLVFKVNGKIPYVDGSVIYSAGAHKTVNLQMGTCIFIGSININGSSAPVGTKIVTKSKADTNVIYDTTVVVQEGLYSIALDGDDVNTSGIKEGPVDGEELLFYVNGVQATASPSPVVFYQGGKYTHTINAEITNQTLCTFVGFNCTLSGEVLPVGTIVKAYKQGTNILCGESSVTTAPGFFELEINKDMGNGDGALDGDTILFTFNDIPAKVSMGSPNNAICREGERLLITLDATVNFCYALFSLVYNQSSSATGLQIDAYTSSNIKCGSGIVDNDGKLLMMITGDDSTTQEIEGPAEGDTIIFKSHGWEPISITTLTPIYYHKLDTLKIALMMFNFDPTEVKEENRTLGKKFALLDPMPNPFNPETIIRFSNDKTQKIKIDIYNMLGMKVKTLVNREYAIGEYKIKWNGTDDSNRKVPAGIYLIKLSNSQGKTSVKKVSFIK